MNPHAPSYAVRVLAVVAAGVWSGCSSGGADPGSAPANDGSPAASSGEPAVGGSGAPGSSSGSTSGSGVGGTGEAGPGAADVGASGFSGGDGVAPSDDASLGTSGANMTDAAGSGAPSTGDAKAETGPSGGSPDGGGGNCNLPATVGFQKDVLPFLTTSCGGGSGCHVIDNASTMAGGGYDHGYDWITAGAHASSCPTTPKRFEVVIAVIHQANPPSCSNSRQMPPPGPGMRAPLTPCQIAALQAWLNEPLVTQLHRPDDSSPTTPYPMPPFN